MGRTTGYNFVDTRTRTRTTTRRRNTATGCDDIAHAIAKKTENRKEVKEEEEVEEVEKVEKVKEIKDKSNIIRRADFVECDLCGVSITQQESRKLSHCVHTRLESIYAISLNSQVRASL